MANRLITLKIISATYTTVLAGKDTGGSESHFAMLGAAIHAEMLSRLPSDVVVVGGLLASGGYPSLKSTEAVGGKKKMAIMACFVINRYYGPVFEHCER